MKVARAGWTSGSFLVYAGALLALFSAASWQEVIAAEHGKGTFAGWSVLFYVVAEALAFRYRAKNRPVVAGLFAVVGLGMFAVMIGAFFSWFGWLHTGSGPFSGFHVGLLALELLILVAAIVGLRLFRFPLLVAPASIVAWLFVTDLISNGGEWSAWVTFLFGLVLFFRGMSLDGGDSRSYGFWVHTTAGLLIGGAFLYWWHRSDAEWAGIIIVALVFIFAGAGMRRSTYAVLGAIGLALATGHYAGSPFGPLFGATSSQTAVAIAPPAITEGGIPVVPFNTAAAQGGTHTFQSADTVLGHFTPWQAPLAYLCLGLFLVLVGKLLFSDRETAETF